MVNAFLRGVNPLATIWDVAKRAGVSIASVSRVINQSPHKVSEKARIRILDAVKELDYRPNALAQGLIMKRSMTIGTIIPDISNPYYAEIVRGIQDVAEGLGYAVVLQNTDRTKKRIIKCIQVLREKRADGIIFSGGIIHAYEALSSLKELTGRVVVIGRHEVDFPAVRVDNMGGATQAVQHLLDLGHERIGFFSGPKMSTSSIDRLKGYKNALAQNGRLFDAGLVKQGNLTPESGFQAAKEVLGRRERPTAILASNDLMAFGAIRAARSMGLRVPQDLSVVGFDNIPLSSYFEPPLTTVEIPMYSVGAASMQMLADLMSGREFSRIRLFTTRLLVRESSAKMNGG
jgi:DNA-binding LacI/PurR family transcriptional regulator